MKSRLSLIMFLSLMMPAAVLSQGTKDINFPSASDVKLIVTQARRATEQFELAVQLEKTLLGSQGKEGIQKDKKVLQNLKFMNDAFDKHPEDFNSVAGFDFVTTLDDASRNAVLCSAQAMALASSAGVGKNYSSVRTMLSLAQSCSNAGVLLYTVSESASSLYTKYLENMQSLTQTSVAALTACEDASKKSGAKGK